MLILITGLPGTGKTTIARKMADKVDAILIDSDDIKTESVPKLLGKKFEWYLKTRTRFPFHIRMKVYKNMLSKAKGLLRSNKNVIVTGSFYSKKLRQIFYEFAKKQGIQLIIINIVCPEDVIRERIIKRKMELESSKKVIATFDIYKKEKKLWQPIKRKHFTIDNSKNIENQIDDIFQ